MTVSESKSLRGSPRWGSLKADSPGVGSLRAADLHAAGQNAASLCAAAAGRRRTAGPPAAPALHVALFLALLALLLCAAPLPCAAQGMQTPASTRMQTRGVHTPAIRPQEYKAKLQESRAAEQRVRSLRPRAAPAQKFSHPRKNAKPRMSSDRLTGR